MKMQDVQYFRVNGQTTHHHYWRQIPDLSKGCKSDFVKALSSQVDETFKQPNLLPDFILSSVYLIDMMSFVQKYQHLENRTFDYLFTCSCKFAKFMQIKPVGCILIDISGDDGYDFDGQCTLKGDEKRKKRTVKEFHPSDNLEIPNWKDLTKNPNNKANLHNVTLLLQCSHPQILPRSITYMLGGMMEDGGQTVIIRNGLSEVVDELSFKSHEEADTRMFAHLAFCLETFAKTRAIIHATDTNIIMLSCYHLLSLEGL